MSEKEPQLKEHLDETCVVCGDNYVENGVTEMFFGVPVDSSGENLVNICGKCVNREEYARFVKDDDFYRLEIHEPKQEHDAEQRRMADDGTSDIAFDTWRERSSF